MFGVLVWKTRRSSWLARFLPIASALNCVRRKPVTTIKATWYHPKPTNLQKSFYRQACFCPLLVKSSKNPRMNPVESGDASSTSTTKSRPRARSALVPSSVTPTLSTLLNCIWHFVLTPPRGHQNYHFSYSKLVFLHFTRMNDVLTHFLCFLCYRNLASRSTVVISSDYSLSKRKLFRSSH